MAIKSVSNPQALGKLIAKWAGDPNSRPKTVQEFIQQANTVGGAGVNLEGAETDIVMTPMPKSSPTEIHLLLPHPDDIAETKRNLPTGRYPLHPDYDDAFVPPAQRRNNMSSPEIDRFNDMVIGLYTTKKCQ